MREITSFRMSFRVKMFDFLTTRVFWFLLGFIFKIADQHPLPSTYVTPSPHPHPRLPGNKKLFHQFRYNFEQVNSISKSTNDMLWVILMISITRVSSSIIQIQFHKIYQYNTLWITESNSFTARHLQDNFRDDCSNCNIK